MKYTINTGGLKSFVHTGESDFRNSLEEDARMDAAWAASRERIRREDIAFNKFLGFLVLVIGGLIYYFRDPLIGAVHYFQNLLSGLI